MRKKSLQLFSRFAGASQCLHAHFFISSRNRTKNLTYVGGPDIGFRLISPSFSYMYAHARTSVSQAEKMYLGKDMEVGLFFEKKTLGNLPHR